MRKEFVIGIIIIVTITVGNILIKNYTNSAGKDMISKLEELKISIGKNNSEEIEKKLSEVNQIWEEKQAKLAYFIEHNELEKVDVNLVSLKSYVEINDLEEAKREVDESCFSVQHIEEKYAFNLKNIF